MKFARRDFLKASAALGGALTLKSAGLLSNILAAEGPDAPPVVWLQGQSCTGCAVSFLNSIHYTTAEDLLLNKIDVRFQSNVMAAAGDLAVQSAADAKTAGGYVLILEGAIPFGDNGEFCHLWENTSMVEAVRQFAPGAIAILALGTCASYGGIYAANPNPTGTMGVSDALAQLGISKPVINIPGCPAHPDWLVGTVAALLAGQMPALDADKRPVDYFGKTVHSKCPNLNAYNENYGDEDHARGQSCMTCHSPTSDKVPNPRLLGMTGCLFALNCKGRQTYGDCSVRKWNGGAANVYGQEWCVGAGAPCFGCTDPTFPDGTSPFYPGGASVPMSDTISISRAEFHPDTGRLLVEASSSRQPDVVLTVIGYGQMNWIAAQNCYRLNVTGVQQPSVTISVSSNLGGSATSTVTGVDSNSDTVTITRAVYDAERRRLVVRAASSDQPKAVLTVTGYGQMTWNSDRRYYQLIARRVTEAPAAVNVTSSLGGSASAAVNGSSAAAPDTVRVTRATYESDYRRLIVLADSTRQPEAVLTVSGYGQMNWLSDRSCYRLAKTGLSRPSEVTVTSSLGGSAAQSVTSISRDDDDDEHDDD